MKNKENNIFVDKWFLIFVKMKKEELFKKKLFSMIKLHKLEKIIKDIKIPSKMKLIQNDETKKIDVKKINLHKGYLVLKINVKKENRKFIIPNEIKLILNTLKIRFLTFNSINPRPLKEKEVENLIDIQKNNIIKDIKKTNNLTKIFKVNDNIKVNLGDLILEGKIIKILTKKRLVISTFFFFKEILIISKNKFVEKI